MTGLEKQSEFHADFASNLAALLDGPGLYVGDRARKGNGLASIEGMEVLARRVRLTILKMVENFGEGHIGSAFSIVEVLVALYFSVLKADPLAPHDVGRDRFVLSKGHGCAALYATLAERGFISHAELASFLAVGTRLAGHPDRNLLSCLDASTGSLGNGLPVAVGLALAAKLKHQTHRTFVLLGDGELNEGVVWEAAMSAAHLELGNITAIVDRNRMQIAGDSEGVMRLEPLSEKWRSFGWCPTTVDGHSLEQITHALANSSEGGATPSVVIAETVKGKGVSFMEGSTAWHYRCPSASDLSAAYAELHR